MIWHAEIIQLLNDSGLFEKVQLIGAKVRAFIDSSRFLDIHYEPTSGSYSYTLVDLTLPYSGDKRLFGWDDYPHENDPAISGLLSYPHHFQIRDPDGTWIFQESHFRGVIFDEIPDVIAELSKYLSGYIT